MASRHFPPKEQKDVAELTRSVEQCGLRARYSVAEILAVPEISMPPFSEKDTWDVSVTAVGERSCFVTLVNMEIERQLFLDQLNVGLTLMNRYFTSWSRSSFDVNPQNNSVYAARIDSRWYRVRVLCADPSDHVAKVHSLDYGWKNSVYFRCFRNLPLDFITKQPLCNEISIIDSTPPKLHVGDQMSITFVDKDQAGKWRVRMLNHVKSNRPEANVTNGGPYKANYLGQANTNHIRNNNDKNSWPNKGNRGMDRPHSYENPSREQNKVTRETDHYKQPQKSKNVFAQKNSASPQSSNNGSRRSDGRPARGRGGRGGSRMSDPGPHRDRNAGVTETAKRTSPRPSTPEDRNHGGQCGGGGNKKVVFVEDSISPLSSEKQVKYRDTRLPANKVSTLYVVYSGEEGTFAILESFGENFQKIEGELTNLEKKDLSLTLPALGKLCLAPFFDVMYRARVIGVNSQDFSCQVLFVDYGNEANVSMSDIREFPDTIPQDIFAFRIDYEGDPKNPEQNTILKVVPISTRNDGTIEVRVQEVVPPSLW